MESLESKGVDGNDDAGSGHGQGGDLGAKNQAESGFENTGGDGQRDRVVTDGQAEVLAHLTQGAPSDSQSRGDVERVGAHQDEVSGLDGHVGARADGDTEVRPGKGGRVVDTVADHGHLSTTPLKLGYPGGLVAGEHLGDDGVDAQSLRDPCGGGLVVAGEHDDLDAESMQLGYSGVGSVPGGDPR